MVDSGNNNGNGNGGGNNALLLERIARAVENTNAQMGDVKGELAQVNVRLDHMIRFMGARHTDHEQRISALENEVFKKSG